MATSANLSGDKPATPGTVFLGLPGVHVAVGSHIAHFFRGEEERLDVLAPFVKAGVDAGDQCVVITEPSALSTIKSRLRELGVDVESALASGQLVASDGFSEVEEMASLFKALIARARGAGRDVIRIGGDMTWSLGKVPTAEKLLEWEAFYDGYVGPLANFVALCQYDHSRFQGSAVMVALQTHPLSIIGNIVQANPFYRDPDEVLRELSSGEPSAASA